MKKQGNETRIYVFIHNGSNWEIRKDSLTPADLRGMYAIMRSHMESDETLYEEAYLVSSKAKYYLCMERSDLDTGHVANVWACSMKDMQTREISGDKRIIFPGEVLA